MRLYKKVSVYFLYNLEASGVIAMLFLKTNLNSTLEGVASIE